MKTIADIKALETEINSAIQSKKGLLHDQSSAFICGPEGSFASDEEMRAAFEAGETIRLCVDICRWRENARTLTAAGCEEISNEESAESDIVSEFGLEDNGYGDGDGCKINCYIAAEIQKEEEEE